jgi:hypothetical protein
VSEKINKHYKPDESQAAVTAICNETHLNYEDAKDVLKKLHAVGWRLVKTND